AVCAQWAQYQIEDLFTNGVNGVHLYVMNDFKIIQTILQNFSH
ncbi:MAG: Methylenetetrahydrofolate reductase, partial [Pseudomonadota bacterium]